MRYTWSLILLCLFGCFTPKESSRSQTINDTAKVQAAQNADFHQHIASGAQPTIHTETDPKTGKTITDITPQPQDIQTRVKTSGTVNAETEYEGMWSWVESIPLGAKLILLAIGLFLLGAVIWILVRSSRAASAAISTADRAFADVIDKYDTHAAESSDPREKVKHLTTLRALEKKRGQMRAKK